MKTILAALAVAVVVLVALTLRGLRDDSSPAPNAARTARSVAVAASPSTAWQAPIGTEESDPMPGTVPVSQLDPPRPDPAMPMPVLPAPPPNPALHRPPMDNPGGVNGDRPERP